MKSLPKNPNLDYLKKEAKKLRSLHRDSNPSCCARIRQLDTSFLGKHDQEILDANFSVMDSQRIIAREYGYTSWARLKHYIHSLTDNIYQGVSNKRAYQKLIVDSYDERSKNYDNSEWHRNMAIQLVDYAPPAEGQKVLDLATGTGTIAFHAAALVAEMGTVTGIDISKSMIAKCNEKLKDSKLQNLDFIYADAENLEFKANSFDRIYCASAFFWMSHPLAALRHWIELLKPDGRLGFHAWPDNSEIWGNISRKVLKNYGINYTIHQATGSVEKCRQMLELAGYKNIEIHEVKDGRFLSLQDAKGSLLNESDYAPGQYPHPLKNVPEEILTQAQVDFDIEVEKLNTDKGVWHDMSMFYVFGQKI